MAPFRGRGEGNGRGGRGGGGGRGGRGGFGAAGRGRGGSRGAYGGPKLPSTLLEKVDSTYGADGRRGEMTRKEKRKSERDEKRRPSTQGRGRPSSEESDEEEDDVPPPPPKKARTKPSVKPASSEEEPKKEKKKLPELRLPEQVEGDAEDEEIEWLEWMLKKEKGKGKEVDDDGLDDILEFATVIGPGGKGLKRNAKGGIDDEDEDEDEGEDADGMSDLDGSDDLEGSSEEGEGSEDEEEWSGIGEDESGAEEEDGTVHADEDESTEGQDAEIDLDEEDLASDKSADREEESSERTNGPDRGQTSDQKTPLHPDIEAPLTTDASAPVAAPTKYVPPHLRAAQLEESARGNKEKAEERVRLERKAQGLLNKLSEANLESILGEIEGLYRGHSRNDVSTTLTNLVIQMISNKANLLDSFVVLYATLVGALHRVIGMEFGAHFVHTLIMRYHKLTTDSSVAAVLEANIYETPDASKEALNLLTLVAELYNAQVVGSKLIYDLVRGFLEGGSETEVMGEREVEGLLKILRCSGVQLRTDDPASLKDIVNLVQDKTKGKEKTMTARARFLVETLTNVKNGKVKSLSGTEAGNEAASRMKKFLNGLGKKRRLLAYEPLRVSLADLLSADKKGKWWLVGAGWSGNPLVELQQAGNSAPETKKKAVKEVNDEEALLELARKQGMNTDVRRGVFVVLMTSEDYVHACDRLSLFKLSEVQQREFVRVALHCCGLEKTYNAYYTLILSHLCANSYDHRFTLQYALWDFMRELDGAGKVSKQRIGNVAKALGYVVARGGLELTVFKALDFTSLSTPLLSFLTTFIAHMIISLHTTSPIFTLPKSFVEADFDAEAVSDKFEKTLSNSELAGGWLYVLDRGKVGDKLGSGSGFGERETELVKKGVKVGKAVLGNAV